MGKYIRILIVIALVLGIAFLANNNVAWARTGAEYNQTVQSQAESSLAVDKPEKGTVKPPSGDVVITKSGAYSIGGFCIYTVKFISTDISVHVSVERPLPRPLPDKVHAVRQGCRVTYYQRPHGVRIDEFTPQMGTSTICFAAFPIQNSKIHFLNIYSTDPTWVPTETTVENGVACSDAGKSGVYAGTFEKP